MALYRFPEKIVMATLSSEQRRFLENTVAAARDAAERGAAKALTSLGVAGREAPGSLGTREKTLRNQLRAHGRQLGDKRHPTGEQETTRLKQACAYEYWHRMLFARFLAENNLLLSPEYGVAMSLTEIQETARAQNLDWMSLASDYAQRMLLEVFRPDDPVLQTVMPPENRQELEELLSELHSDIFTSEDSLGWVYQFWQRDEKERVNKSEVKIGADELSPVTQLFTEDYMVLFLLHNTLGAWWRTKRCGEGKDPKLADYEWTYLRLNQDGSPAAGQFEAWPKTVRELRVLDPCMGSGHFLAFALPILTRMRMEEEGSSLAQAIQNVLRENIFGLELDARCSQIAAFNLALTAWQMLGQPIELPTMNLACSGLGINASEQSWISLAGDNALLRDTLSELYATFQKAPILGSLIDPTRVGRPLLIAKFDEVWPLLERALAAEQRTDEFRELAIAAKGVVSTARTLANKFTLVATNVPYLGRGRQSEDLHRFANDYFKDAADDLAQVFFDRCLRFLSPGCSIALIAPQKWTYAPRYKHYRRRFLNESQLDLVGLLGTGAFRAITGEVVDPGAFIATAGPSQVAHKFSWIDVTKVKGADEKASKLRTDPIQELDQGAIFANRDCIVRPPFSSSVPLLNHFAFSVSGLKSGDNDRFNRFFWEIPSIDSDWEVLQGAATGDAPFEGMMNVIYWQQGQGELAHLAERMKGSNHVVQNWRRGQDAWGQRGVAISATGRIRASSYLGDRFDSAVTVIVPHDADHLEPIWRFCRSPLFPESIKHIDNKLSVTTATLLNVPFDLARWKEAGTSNLPTLAESSNQTQWLFSGHPAGSENPLQVAVARMMGYRWPRQTGSSFPSCPPLEEDELKDHADSDGIACLSSNVGEAPAADRLRALLAKAYGAHWSAAKLAALLNGSESLELWLRDRFFEEHCEVFRNRPFIWHVWDGRKDGFHALVNYHKLTAPNGEGRKTLEKLIYTSLGDWINRQRSEVTSGADGAEGRLSASLQLQSELEQILRGEPPHDVFVRWKGIHEQAIGWDPDLNDGVRVNIRPWLMAKPYQPSKKDACILRVTPIKLPLGKDRGKEADGNKIDFPWFAETRDRNNDIHLTLDQKRKARERKKA